LEFLKSNELHCHLLCAKCNLENGAVRISDIKDKIARVATREFGNDRVSRKKEEERESCG
jgi:hypothetical protein